MHRGERRRAVADPDRGGLGGHLRRGRYGADGVLRTGAGDAQRRRGRLCAVQSRGGRGDGRLRPGMRHGGARRTGDAGGGDGLRDGAGPGAGRAAGGDGGGREKGGPPGQTQRPYQRVCPDIHQLSGCGDGAARVYGLQRPDRAGHGVQQYGDLPHLSGLRAVLQRGAAGHHRAGAGRGGRAGQSGQHRAGGDGGLRQGRVCGERVLQGHRRALRGAVLFPEHPRRFLHGGRVAVPAAHRPHRHHHHQ